MARRFILVRALAVHCICVRASATWVDPDTPIHSKRTEPLTQGDDRFYHLVFSDEFETDGRTFHDGNDPRWTALNKNDYTNEALHFYSHDNASTKDGKLKIVTNQKKNKYRAFNEETKKFYWDTKHVQSAMLQGWNKFCFTGGIVEFKAKLPGNPRYGGLWPALWLLGNLARATFVGSSDHMWPFSYNQCDPKTRVSQEISACSQVNHFGLTSNRGRGAPEIDIIEAMQGDKEKLPNTNITRPYQSASLQLAPGVPRGRPILGKPPRKGHWYEGMQYSNRSTSRSELNPFFYGVTLVHEPKRYTYQADALSANLQLTSTFYEEQHIFRVEWEPPEEDGSGGYIKWYTDEVFIYGIDGANLNITGTEIPSEPMYLLMNTAVSKNWGFPMPCPEGCDCACFNCDDLDCMCGLPEGYCDNLPASFDIEYVRVYQAMTEDKHIQGCSPQKRPTALFIKGHEDRYKSKEQKYPLLPVEKGGASCNTDADCGGTTMGSCLLDGRCKCKEGHTGPTCLAHDGSYLKKWNTTIIRDTLPESKMHVPNSLITFSVLLVIGLILCTVVGLQRQTKRQRYKRLDIANAEVVYHHNQHHHQHQHQNHQQQQLDASSDGSSSAHRKENGESLYGSLNDVTYCVIDRRLLDDGPN